MKPDLRTTIHRDGTVTYWSVYEQRWYDHAFGVPDRELAAMRYDERERVLRAMARHNALDETNYDWE